MIIRDGNVVEYRKSSNVKLAERLISIAEVGTYETSGGATIDISSGLLSAMSKTIYLSNKLKPISGEINPEIVVMNQNTVDAAKQWKDSNVAILNFSSAYHPGGGFRSGAVAQEEDICRHSLLYSCLAPMKDYYADNFACGNPIYTDGIIYSPNVPFIVSDGKFIDPYYASVISCAAPNVTQLFTSDETYTDQDLKKVLVKRAEKILRVLATNGHKNIVLGAWGCGVFGNSPKMVAKAWKEALSKVRAFEKVKFAILDKSKTLDTLNAFNKEFNQSES
jgi:uncharacterized protein (TIGR02452 family)